MILLLLGGATLAVMMGALGMFSRARIATIKSFGVWVAAIGGLALAALLFLTGKGPLAVAALALLGPMVWGWMRNTGAKEDSGPASATKAAPLRSGSMTRAKALDVLGLPQGASESDIRDAHLRLMRVSHPDAGGSDWLASRVNQARDVLLP